MSFYDENPFKQSPFLVFLQNVAIFIWFFLAKKELIATLYALLPLKTTNK
jgi:hypothetical protein